MKKIALLLALLLLLSACGKIDNTADVPPTDEPAEVASPSPSMEVETPPSEEPSAAPTVEPEPSVPLWQTMDIVAPAEPTNGKSAPAAKPLLSTLPVDYSPEQAELDGCYGTDFTDDGRYFTFGEDAWEEFEEYVNSGFRWTVRKYEGWLPKAKTDLPPTVTDIKFDGQNMIYRQFVRDTQMGLEYDYIRVRRKSTEEFKEIVSSYDNDKEKAHNDGCIVINKSKAEILYDGVELWSAFCEKVDAGQKAAVRFFNFFEDTEHTYVLHLEFDGELFILTEILPNDERYDLVSTVYTNMSTYEKTNWGTLNKEIKFVLNYSSSYTYEYLMNCQYTYFDYYSAGTFLPPFMELFMSHTTEKATLDDFVLPEGGLVDESALSNEPHIYEIVPGTDEWNALSAEERFEVTTVTKEEVEGMTTQALVKTVITYPFFGNISIYSTLQMGMEFVALRQPALNELFSRQNAYYELVKFRIESYDELELIDQMFFGQLLLYYENFVLMGLHEMPEE